MNDQADAFETARENDSEVNELLADTGGKIAVMQYDGAIGYHEHVASGETEPEYLWHVALLQALDQTLLEQVHIDAKTVPGAVSQLERQLGGDLHHHTLERLTDRFGERLRGLVEVQEEVERI